MASVKVDLRKDGSVFKIESRAPQDQLKKDPKTPPMRRVYPAPDFSAGVGKGIEQWLGALQTAAKEGELEVTFKNGSVATVKSKDANGFDTTGLKQPFGSRIPLSPAGLLAVIEAGLASLNQRDMGSIQKDRYGLKKASAPAPEEAEQEFSVG